MFIWRKTYGFNKKIDFIANKQFVDELGIKKGHVSRTLSELLELNIIFREGKKMGVVKNWENWKVEKRGDMSKFEKLPVQEPRVTSTGNKKLPLQGDTIYSKDTIQKTISDKSDLSNKKTKMKQYEEPSTDYKTRQSSIPKKGVSNDTTRLRKYFYEQCFVQLGVRPKESPGRDNKMAKEAMTSLKSKDRAKELIAEWFSSGKENADLIQITQCLSTVNINRYLANHPI
jgi:hypothetical protein